MSKRASVWLAIAFLTTLAACAPAELPTPTPQEVEEIVAMSFPNALVDVVAVQRSDSTVRAPARFRGSDVVLVLEEEDGQWAIRSVELGDASYDIDELEAIRQTMILMEDVSNALEEYASANGQIPQMDDLVGLEDLVPDYFPQERGFEDGWGTPLHYRIQGEDYVLTSAGPDGEVGTQDDIIIVRG